MCVNTWTFLFLTEWQECGERDERGKWHAGKSHGSDRAFVHGAGAVPTPTPGMDSCRGLAEISAGGGSAVCALKDHFQTCFFLSVVYFSARVWQLHQAFLYYSDRTYSSRGTMTVSFQMYRFSKTRSGEDWWPAGIKVAIIYLLTSFFFCPFSSSEGYLLWQMAFTTSTGNTTDQPAPWIMKERWWSG